MVSNPHVRAIEAYAARLRSNCNSRATLINLVPAKQSNLIWIELRGGRVASAADCRNCHRVASSRNSDIVTGYQRYVVADPIDALYYSSRCYLIPVKGCDPGWISVTAICVHTIAHSGCVASDVAGNRIGEGLISANR